MPPKSAAVVPIAAAKAPTLRVKAPPIHDVFGRPIQIGLPPVKPPPPPLPDAAAKAGRGEPKEKSGEAVRKNGEPMKKSGVPPKPSLGMNRPMVCPACHSFLIMAPVEIRLAALTPSDVLIGLNPDYDTSEEDEPEEPEEPDVEPEVVPTS